MRGKKVMENGTRFVGFESFENRVRLR